MRKAWVCQRNGVNLFGWPGVGGRCAKGARWAKTGWRRAEQGGDPFGSRCLVFFEPFITANDDVANAQETGDRGDGIAAKGAILQAIVESEQGIHQLRTPEWKQISGEGWARHQTGQKLIRRGSPSEGRELLAGQFKHSGLGPALLKSICCIDPGHRNLFGSSQLPIDQRAVPDRRELQDRQYADTQCDRHGNRGTASRDFSERHGHSEATGEKDERYGTCGTAEGQQQSRAGVARQKLPGKPRVTMSTNGDDDPDEPERRDPTSKRRAPQKEGGHHEG